MEKLLDVISLSIFLNMDKYFPWGQFRTMQMTTGLRCSANCLLLAKERNMFYQ